MTSKYLSFWTWSNITLIRVNNFHLVFVSLFTHIQNSAVLCLIFMHSCFHIVLYCQNIGIACIFFFCNFVVRYFFLYSIFMQLCFYMFLDIVLCCVRILQSSLVVFAIFVGSFFFSVYYMMKNLGWAVRVYRTYSLNPLKWHQMPRDASEITAGGSINYWTVNSCEQWRKLRFVAEFRKLIHRLVPLEKGQHCGKVCCCVVSVGQMYSV